MKIVIGNDHAAVEMKKDIFGIKVSTILTIFACIVIAFLLWLYFNI
mgnify:CR=1 FL=1